MSKKHIMNAGICCICTAVIFGLHFWFPPNHIVTRLCQLIWCAGLSTMLYALCIAPYSLDSWMFFPLWIAFTIIELVRREKNPAAYAVSMVLVLCITGAFLLIAHPITASQAQSIVEQAGYTDCVYYKVDPNNNTAYKDGPGSEALYFSAPEPADKSDYYAFSANKDGEKYGVLVSYFRGTIDEKQKQGV